jgi:transposase InsO family protein
MKYAFIQRNKLVWPICVQCRVLLVSVSGSHEHLARRVDIAQRRHLNDEALLVHISAVYAENRGACGWPRIWRQLRAQGIRVGKQRVQRLSNLMPKDARVCDQRIVATKAVEVSPAEANHLYSQQQAASCGWRFLNVGDASIAWRKER